ncbi:MAG: hypothetical protein ACFCU2_07865 [Acidimicrobiia bacterium]
MTGPALDTLLSQVLVAYTIELDNEWERQLLESKRPRIFLLSFMMWANYLRLIPTAGIPAGGLEELAQHKVDLNGLTRWRYATVEPPEGMPKAPRREWIVCPTDDGLFACDLWEPLPALIESRWRERYGATVIEDLEIALQSLIDRFDHRPTPLYLPDVTSRDEMFTLSPPATGTGLPNPGPLFALLSRVLLELTLDFEAGSSVALPIAANTLRVSGPEPTPIRDLPERAGVSKEGTAQALTVLARHDLVAVEPIRNGRGKQALLTPRGLAAQSGYHDRLDLVETQWRARYGGEPVNRLAKTLMALVGDSNILANSPLAEAMEPPPGVWRASPPPPRSLPFHPMVIGRGGWPDAS